MQTNSYHKRRSAMKRRGMTLIELLMVCFILVLFVALAAPLLRPATADRKVREAARQLNAYIAEAKAYAAQRGRPVGLAFDRAQATDEGARDSNIITRMYIAESPPIYAGDTLGSSVIVRPMSRDDDGDNTNNPDVVHLQQPPWYDYFNEPAIAPPPGPIGLVPASNAVVEINPPQINGIKARWYQLRFQTIDAMGNPVPNDPMMYVIAASYIPRQPAYRYTPFRIRFRQRGGWYDGYMEYLGTADPPVFNASTALTEFRFFCWAPFGKAAPITGPYQIEFPPVVAADTPLELPTGTVVDLRYSGFGRGGNEFAGGGSLPLVVVFSPSGEVDRIFTGGTYTNRASKMHFFVGTLDRAVEDTGLLDAANQWVSLAALTGHVTTADNLPPSDLSNIVTALTQARGFAMGISTTGGR